MFSFDLSTLFCIYNKELAIVAHLFFLLTTFKTTTKIILVLQEEI